MSDFVSRLIQALKGVDMNHVGDIFGTLAQLASLIPWFMILGIVLRVLTLIVVVIWFRRLGRREGAGAAVPNWYKILTVFVLIIAAVILL